MLHSINPTQTSAWNKLKEHFNNINNLHMKDLFKADPSRFNRFSLESNGILFDYSKNRITQDTISLLSELAQEVNLQDGIKAMFSGDKINATENRAVLHTALRQQSDNPVEVSGENIIPKIRRVQAQMKNYCTSFHANKIIGYTGKPLHQIVNIGIGGSDLGPVMVTEALKPYWAEGISTHFVSNVDGSHIAEILKQVNPETTLFIIASKTFTTQETMTNAHTAKEWFLKNGGINKDIEKHFVALSTNIEAAQNFGISADKVFGFWDWVGGRYSLTSAIGLSIALTIGYSQFEFLLEGMGAMDQHFRDAPYQDNIPVLMALLGIWYNNFFGADSEAILPYDQYLHRFPAYFQQGNMESNGKSIDRNGEPVNYQTGPIIWGEPGTNGQHAFYQLIHQGSKLIPCDFIATAVSHNKIGDHHNKLLSNFFAQTEALMNGKDESTVIQEFKEKGLSKEAYEKIVPFKIFDGNKPTNSILVQKLTPYILGQLIAMYEHKIFVQGYIWNIYSFDQWGVELGKQLARKILPELDNEHEVHSHDSSTNGLINSYKKMRSN